MARVADMACVDEAARPVVARLYLGYYSPIDQYVAFALLPDRHDFFLSTAAPSALALARSWVQAQGLRIVGESPAQGPRSIRLVRSAGAPLMTDTNFGVQLDEQDVATLATLQNQSQLKGFLDRVLSSGQSAILAEWRTDPSCSWALVPADAQKAASRDADFAIDEDFLQYMRGRVAR